MSSKSLPKMLTVCILSVYFVVMFFHEVLAADNNDTPPDISGLYMYEASYYPPRQDDTWFDLTRAIHIVKMDSGGYSVTIYGDLALQGDRSFAYFYGTGTIADGCLFVTNIVTHKGKPFPLTLKIYLQNHPDLASYAKNNKEPAYSKLKTGQIAVIDEGGLPQQFPNGLEGYQAAGVGDYGEEENFLLPDESPMFEGTYEHPGFGSIYSKISALDCARAENPVEKAICGNIGLVIRDARMTREYRELLHIVSDKEVVRAEQRQWLRSMHAQCSDANLQCIRSQYAERTSQFETQEAAEKKRVERLKDITDVHVSNAEEFVAAIASGRRITLAEGQYVLSEEGLVIRDIVNLTIQAAPGADVEIVAPASYTHVIQFTSCDGILLRGIKAGHVADSCVEGVLEFIDSHDISIEDCFLYGSGTVGISMYDCTAATVSKTTITDCSQSAVELSGCDDIDFTDCKLVDNRAYADVVNVTSTKATFSGCEISGNKNIESGYLVVADEDSDIVFDGCTFQNNARVSDDTENDAVFRGKGISVKNSVVEKNNFAAYLDGGRDMGGNTLK